MALYPNPNSNYFNNKTALLDHLSDFFIKIKQYEGTVINDSFKNVVYSLLGDLVCNLHRYTNTMTPITIRDFNLEIKDGLCNIIMSNRVIKVFNIDINIPIHLCNDAYLGICDNQIVDGIPINSFKNYAKEVQQLYSLCDQCLHLMNHPLYELSITSL